MKTENMRQEHGKKTVTIFDNNTECVAYLSSANVIADVCGIREDLTNRGACTFKHRQLDTILPQLVAAGYKIAIIDD